MVTDGEQLRRRESARKRLSAFAAHVRLDAQMMALADGAERSMLDIAQHYGESVTSSVRDTMAAKVAELDELCGDIRGYEGMYASYLDEVSDAIERVCELDAQAGTVLAMRYLAWGRPPELGEIAERMGYSLEWVKKLHATGLDIAADVLGVER